MAIAQRTNMGVDLSGMVKWQGIATGPDGKLYCAPYSATDILVIDPVAGTATRTNMGADLSGDYKWQGIATGPDGKLYCAPRNATDILVIDPVLPAGLYFKDTMGYLSTANGGILRRMEFPRVYQGLASAPKRITVEIRATGAIGAIKNVQINVEEQPEEDTVELSLTDDPFVPEALPVTLPGPYNVGNETDPVYVRVVAGEKSTTRDPRVVGLSVKAQPIVE